MTKIMTDRETIEAMLKRAGIVWKTKACNPPEEDNNHIYVHRGRVALALRSPSRL